MNFMKKDIETFVLKFQDELYEEGQRKIRLDEEGFALKFQDELYEEGFTLKFKDELYEKGFALKYFMKKDRERFVFEFQRRTL